MNRSLISTTVKEKETIHECFDISAERWDKVTDYILEVFNDTEAHSDFLMALWNDSRFTNEELIVGIFWFARALGKRMVKQEMIAHVIDGIFSQFNRVEKPKRKKRNPDIEDQAKRN